MHPKQIFHSHVSFYAPVRHSNPVNPFQSNNLFVSLLNSMWFDCCCRLCRLFRQHTQVVEIFRKMIKYEKCSEIKMFTINMYIRCASKFYIHAFTGVWNACRSEFRLRLRQQICTREQSSRETTAENKVLYSSE